MRRWLIALALVVGSAIPASAQGTICFSQNFNSGSTPFNFAFAQTPGSNWTRNFPATGGYNSTPGLEIIFNAGFEQYDSGYSSGIGGCSFDTNDDIFIRFWIRYNSNYRWNGDGSMQDKMVIFGDNDTDSRFIFMNERNNSSRPCTPPDSITSEQGSFSLMKNIGGDPGEDNIDCTPYYLMTHSTVYFIQYEVDAADDCLRLWINNNNQGSPTRSYCGENGGGNYSLGTDVNEIKWGGFMSDTPAVSAGKVWDNLVVATDFDPNWCEGTCDGGGEPGGGDPVDPTPRRLPVRIKPADGLLALGAIGLLLVRLL